MKRFIAGLALSTTLVASAASALADVDARGVALGYWAEAKANGAPPRIGGCLNPTAAKRVVAMQSAAVAKDQATWLESWLKGSEAYDERQSADGSSWKAQQEIVDRQPESPADNAAVASDLAARAALDKAVRAAKAPAGLSPDARAIHDSLLAQAVCRTDEANTRWLKTVVQERGWPDRKRFSAAADHDATLLVEHAVNDLTWQREALAVVRGLLDTDATDPVNVAVLADRISVVQGKAQRFGTQGACAGPGRWMAEMVENPEEIDDRRAELGLPSLIESAAALSKSCR